MASKRWNNSKEPAERGEEDGFADLTDEDDDDDSADLLDIPVNVEIITEEESDDSPPFPPGKRPRASYPVENVAACNVENLKENLRGKSARECFEEFFSDEVFETVVRETERYAAHVKNKKDFAVTVTDVKIFLGFMIFAGYHRLPCERDYWSDDEDLGIPLVKAAMTRNAFAELKSCLHFQDNAKAREYHADKYFKIRPLVDMLNKNFQKWDVLHESLSAGEMMVSCYGVNRTKRRKPVRVVYRLGALCGDGYCYKFWLCSEHREGDAQEIYEPRDSDPHCRENQLDDFRFLSNLKNGPPGEKNQQQVTSKKCALGVKYYELLLRKHSIPIRGKKWYWCLITRMIDMAIVNAYHIFRESQDAHKCIKQFRREIAVPYLKLGHCRRISRSLAPNPSRTHVNEDVRFDGLNHIIGKREKQRRCQFQNCKGRPKTYCVKCNITLCTTCFPQFHFR